MGCDGAGIIKIEGADLSTSSLMFHAFHDILAVTDNQGVGIWSLESGNQVSVFLEMNCTNLFSTFCCCVMECWHLINHHHHHLLLPADPPHRFDVPPVYFQWAEYQVHHHHQPQC
jgi:hypothetical protein